MEITLKEPAQNVGGTNVGAGLARDASASVFQLHRGDAIAAMRRPDKPAPTLGLQWVLKRDRLSACERVRQGAAVHQFQLATQRYAMGDP